MNEDLIVSEIETMCLSLLSCHKTGVQHSSLPFDNRSLLSVHLIRLLGSNKEEETFPAKNLALLRRPLRRMPILRLSTN